jgi:hypothetical protein
MSDVALPTRKTGTTLPRDFVLSELPEGSSYLLGATVHRLLHPHPDIVFERPRQRIRDEAAAALEVILPLLIPASAEALTAFLWPVADAVEFVPEEDVFFRRVNVLHMATQDMPHVAWTQQACMALCRSAGRYLPSVQQIIEAVEPGIRPLLQRERALKQIIGQRDA